MTNKRKIKNCKFTYEVTELVANEIRKLPKYKECEIETYGPFGLTCKCSVSVKNVEGELVGFLSVVYGSDDAFPFRYIDYNEEPLHKYPKGSIGDLNGMNYITKNLPTDNDEVVELVFANRN